MPTDAYFGKDPGKLVKNIIERRDESRKRFKTEYADEFTEVWRAIKCRTKPILKKNLAGNQTTQEDKSRTNIATPTLNIILRKNAARMTAQPYRLDYIGGDPAVAALLSSNAMQQYDRSNEALHDLKVVMAGEAFGFGCSKLYYDCITPVMNFRKAIMKGKDVVYRDRASIMQYQGAKQDEIVQAVGELGPEMDDQEIADFIKKSGTIVKLPIRVKKYEGPAVKFVFNGDIFFEHTVSTMQDSSWIIEQYQETDVWVTAQAQKSYPDEQGNLVPIFDPEALAELLSSDTTNNEDKDKDSDLRDMFNAAAGRQSAAPFPKNLRVRKRFQILEEHCQEEDGKLWITFVSPDYMDKPLGRMPYQFDFYGQYAYTDHVPLPDLISPFGDSTPRLLRYIHALQNLTLGQNFDAVTNVMKRFMLRLKGSEVGGVTDRGIYRELEVDTMGALTELSQGALTPAMFERGNELWRLASIAEPSLNQTDAGTETNPQAGKTATTAILGAKAADALTQFKLDGRNRYLKSLGQKKAWMNQDSNSPFEVQARFFTDEVNQMLDQQQEGGQQPQIPPEWVLSGRDGKTSAIRVDPMEMQEDYEVVPRAGSYLSLDDDLRMGAAQRLFEINSQAPGIIDLRKAVQFALGTIREIGPPQEMMMPEQTEPSPPPFKGNVGINMPLDKMPADIVNQVLPLFGLQPSQELVHKDTLAGVKQISEASDAASNLFQPSDPPDPEEKKVTNKVNGKSK